MRCHLDSKTAHPQSGPWVRRPFAKSWAWALSLSLLVTAGCDARPAWAKATKTRRALPLLTVKRCPSPRARGEARDASRIDRQHGTLPWTDAFVSAQSGAPAGASLGARLQACTTSQGLQLRFEVVDSRPHSRFVGHELDAHVWKGASGVEAMLQPGNRSDNRRYFEVQVGVHGALWDSRFDDYNTPVRHAGPGSPPRFGHEEWRSESSHRVIRQPYGYAVVLDIPWESIAAKPRSQAIWRANFYAFTLGQAKAVAWSALLGRGNFHRASRFGRLVFE